MTEKSCFTCKHFEVRNNFHTDTGQDAFKTSLKKCGWEYLIYDDTPKMREFFKNIYCNNWEVKDD